MWATQDQIKKISIPVLPRQAKGRAKGTEEEYVTVTHPHRHLAYDWLLHQ